MKSYADEGISGTSLAHRDEFNAMISDCKAGRIDLIITKSVSRFARNVTDFIGTVRLLSELKSCICSPTNWLANQAYPLQELSIRSIAKIRCNFNPIRRATALFKWV